MTEGENMPTWIRQGELAEIEHRPLRADDFVSDGRRITDIHWWGSYLGWRVNTEGPTPPPSNAVDRPVGFRLRWHGDIPAGSLPYSRPEPMPARDIFVPIGACHEMYYGSVTQYWKPPVFPSEDPPHEHEYQYYVDLLDPELADLGGPWYETNGVIYWLSIQAVFSNQWEAVEHKGWGWKTTHPSNQWNDVSVVASNYVGPDPLWEMGEFPMGPPPHPWVGQKMDLAFELTTDEVATNRWYRRPEFVRIRKGAASLALGSVGDLGSGMQVLQTWTNLPTSNWMDVATNTLPWPPPYTNVWYPLIPATREEYYRIEQR
jgi:hypothetical protein